MKGPRENAPILLTPFGALLGASLILLMAAGPAPVLDSNRPLGPGTPDAADNGFGAASMAAAESADSVTSLEPGAGWFSFTWYGFGPVSVGENPFVLDTETPVTLRITDDFCGGDVFRVYEVLPNGEWNELGKTFYSPRTSGWGHGPDAAFADRTWSSGIYSLPAGHHEIRVQLAGNPWGMGRGYVRVDREHTFSRMVPEDVLTNYGPVRHVDNLRYRAALELGDDSDGIWPHVEEIVIAHGNYLEVIPAGQVLCNGIDCVYTSDLPGIQQLILQPNRVFFRGAQVDLCPGANPMKIGIWIGNDGGSVELRCEGSLHE